MTRKRKPAPVVTLVPRNAEYDRLMVETTRSWLSEIEAGGVKAVAMMRVMDDGTITTVYGTSRLGSMNDVLVGVSRLEHRVQQAIDAEVVFCDDDPDPGADAPVQEAGEAS